MHSTFLLRRALAVSLLSGVLFACDRGEPQGPARSEASAPAVDSAPAEPHGSEVVVIPPFDPSLPPLRLEPPPVPEAQPPEVPAAKVKIPLEDRPRPTAAANAKAEPDHPPLDALFRARYEPPAESTTVDLAPAEPVKPTPKPPRALDRLGDSIRLERRGEAIGPAGPRQGTAWETDAGLRIPVDKSISLEGGVHVESREEPNSKQKNEERRTPKVGVEVRF